jgi:hypothetical protein
MRLNERSMVCPFCERESDATACVSDEEAVPSDGDFTLCFYCGEWAVFSSIIAGGLRKPKSTEYDILGQDKEMQKIRAAWLRMMEERDKPKEPEKPKEPDDGALGPLDRGFRSMVETLYSDGILGKALPEMVKEEFRRHYFAGAMAAIKMLADAHDDDDSDTVVIGSAFEGLIKETNSFVTQNRRGKA